MYKINWDCSKEDDEIILKIVNRFRGYCNKVAIKPARPMYEIAMDVTATHMNGNPLELERLLNAPDADFAHDMFGIQRHIDRETGKLGGCFSPRYSVKETSCQA